MAKLGNCISIDNRFYSPRKADRKAPVLPVHVAIQRAESEGWRFVKQNGKKEYQFKDTAGGRLSLAIHQLRERFA